jgi:beta-barrel assembly-enhancing protease
MTIRGKYFDGQSAVSRPVDLFIEGDLLRIESEAETLGRWPISAIYRDESHSVSIVIGCAAGDDRVEILDAQIVAALKIRSTVWAKRDLGPAQRVLIPSLVALIILIALGIWNSRILTKYLASQVTPQQERKVLSMVEKGKEKDECALNESQAAAFDKLLTRLFSQDPENRKNVSVKFLSIDANNAFTLPGGTIWILKPLLRDVKTPSELAGVLAHEIEHVERRHVIESVIRAAIFTGLLNAMAGDVSGLMLIDPSTASQLLGMKLSREMEQEADDGALKRMLATGISPIGAS